jgi:hypothetical protein
MIPVLTWFNALKDNISYKKEKRKKKKEKEREREDGQSTYFPTHTKW